MHSRTETGSTSRKCQQELTQSTQDSLDIDRSEDEGMSEAKRSSIPRAVIRPEEQSRPQNRALEEASSTDRRVKVHKRGGVFQVTIAGKFHGDYLKQENAISATETVLDRSDD